MAAEEKEVDFARQLLTKLLTDKELHDVKLEGTDGMKVPASRNILAARSCVFRGMLYGKFSEATREVVPVGYKGNVMQSVVEYIHTNEPQLLNFKKRKLEAENGGMDVVAARIPDILSLAAAAAYFDLPGLSQKVCNVMSALIEKNPSLSFVFLEGCRKEGPAVPKELSEMALYLVRSTAGRYINAAAVEGLSASVLEEILKDTEMEMSEADLFNILRLWKDSDPAERSPIAKELMERHIALEEIDPETLSSSALASGLVTKDQLFEAYQNQALSLSSRKRDPGSFQQRRRLRGLAWTTSGKQYTGADTRGQREIETLSCPSMNSGVHQWKIELTEVAHSKIATLGIALEGLPLDSSYRLSEQASCWVATQRGDISCAGVGRGATTEFGFGDIVTFTLDLRPNMEGNGTLSLGVNEELLPTIIASNLRDKLGEHGGFVPVVSTFKPIVLRLVDFRKVWAEVRGETHATD